MMLTAHLHKIQTPDHPAYAIPARGAELAILIIKPTRCTNSQIYFWNRTLHVLDRFSVHHQESSTVHTAIGICHTGFADCLLSMYDLYDIYLLLCTVLDS